jgi:acetylornithine deacetylase/succinyl-diaminopimelate desuccinylase-like protein
VIEGGQSVNIIPDHCSIQIDRRLVPGETPDAAERDLVAWLQDRSTVEFTLERIGCTAAPLQTSQRGRAAARRLQELAQRHGNSIDCIGVPFCTHASAWAAAGVPAVVFGPGSIRQAHAADEWLNTKELLLAEAILADFLRCSLFT